MSTHINDDLIEIIGGLVARIQFLEQLAGMNDDSPTPDPESWAVYCSPESSDAERGANHLRWLADMAERDPVPSCTPSPF